jgi:hypothetical protein
MNRVTQRQYLFHPVTVLLVSLVAAALFALFVILLFEGEFRWFLLYYFTPIGVPFVAFLFERAERHLLTSKAVWALDLAVVIVALIRAFIRIPFISGHAIFLVYCLLTARSKVVRLTALVVLVQVIYLKIFVTADIALFGGILAGYFAALVYRRLQLSQGTVKAENRL